MRLGTLSFAALIGGVALAACAKDQATAPAVPTSATRDVSTTAASCNFQAARADASLYFTTPGPVHEALTKMQIAYTSGGAAAATDKGFDVLTLVSSALSTTGAVAGTPITGNIFVRDVLACMSVGTLPPELSVAGALGPNGMFNVVGGASDATGPMTSRGAPKYGAEPQAGQTWLSSGGQRFLLYGFERDFSFTQETPAAVTAFELATVPTPITFRPAILGGICQTTATNSLIQSVNVILPLQSLSFCSGVTSVQREDQGMFASLTHAAARLFSPAPLYAFGVGGTGSLLSGLSPKGAVTFAPSSAGLTFVQQPFDSHSSSRPQFVPPITVSVKTANGTPVNGVTVTLTTLKNNATFESSNRTAVSRDNGVATFPAFFVNKPGSYTIRASATIFGVATQSAVSNAFTIDGL